MRRRSRRSQPALAAMAALAAAAAAVSLSGCVSARNALGTSSSPCYKALPVATEAVRNNGTLAGIRLVTDAQLDKYAHLSTLLDAKAGYQVKSLCVLSFHGTYQKGQVNDQVGPVPPGGAKVAIVVVSYPQNKLLATFLVNREPLPLRHEVLGVRPAPTGAPPPPT